MRGEHEEQVEAREKVLKSQQSAVDNARKQVENLTRALITGRVSEAEYDVLKPQYDRELLRATAARAGLEEGSKKWIEQAEAAFNFCSRARYWFENGSDEQKRRILLSVGSNFVLTNKKLTIQPDELFAAVQIGVKTRNWGGQRESDP